MPERLATLRMLAGFGQTALTCTVSAALTFVPGALGWRGLAYLLLIPALIVTASMFRRRIRRVADATAGQAGSR